MSKYREALDYVIENIKEYNSIDCFGSSWEENRTLTEDDAREIDILKDAVEKAEKYDLEHCNGRQNIIEHLVEHNNKLKKENQILREGLKIIKSGMVFKENEHIGFYNALWNYDYEKEDYYKIKAMLEVVNND